VIVTSGMKTSLQGYAALCALLCAGGCGDDAGPAETNPAADAGAESASAPETMRETDAASTSDTDDGSETESTEPSSETDEATEGETSERADAGFTTPELTSDPVPVEAADAATGAGSLCNTPGLGTGAECGAADAAVPADAGEPTAALAWTESEELINSVPVEYATFEVPVDYANPDGAKLSLGLARLQTSAEDRTGVVFFNPGGPGAAVIGEAALYAELLGILFPTMDIVLMDNRGMGASAPIDCIAIETAQQWEEEPFSDDAGVIVNEMQQLAAEIQSACEEAQGELLPFYNVENVARDMDAVRVALGEEVINYWGVSYGTLQGALYAEMFPEHVRAFVLDSPVVRLAAGGPDWVQAMIQTAGAYEEQLNRYFGWADEDSQSPLYGLTNEGAAAAFDALQVALDEGVTWEGETLPPGLLLSLTATALRTGTWSQLAQGMADALAGDWQLLVTTYGEEEFGPQNPAAFQAWQANIVINLLDTPCPDGFSEDDALDVYLDLEQRFPRLGGAVGAGVAQCLGWDLPRSEARIIPLDVGAPPMLVMSGLHDPATPYADAVALLGTLNNDSQLLNCSLQAAKGMAWASRTNAGSLLWRSSSTVPI
jgi:pimeloyl-ACP methyl ester carboxylesterase